ncbi:hypothetical protein AUC68_11570 [Methyloceanibacter methanicus]|uniref:SPOR domain-containing protein n=1 Tax=Methyloceanibacter methanicus TaxID=1774968 RepID=A0A1E3VX83_9HYPH|nr:hypothetical protein [Methyloceanibacter methanicus]ODR98119.1 hypothetical protein AUC68_11570 [Methyloceanibacter methanicus]
MLRVWKAGFAILGFSVLLFGAVQTADAGCEIVRATNSAESKAAAAKAAYANALQTAEQIRRRRGWSYVRLRPRKVTPDPFWKAVRPVVTPDMLLKPDASPRRPMRSAGRASWCPMSARPARPPAATSSAAGTRFRVARPA